MRFRGQVNDTIGFVLVKELVDMVFIGNISLHKCVIRAVFNVLEVFQVAGIG
ncbi:hypothetical protein ES705_49688 [subsurface metagenome]